MDRDYSETEETSDNIPKSSKKKINDKIPTTPAPKSDAKQERKVMLDKLNFPFPKVKQIKEKFSDYLDEYVNQPLDKLGQGELGAAASAAADAAAEILVPEDMSDMALGMVPGGKIAKKLGKKGIEAIELVKAKPKPGTINYTTEGIKSFNPEELAALRAKAAASEANALTEKVSERGKKIQMLKPPTRKKSDLDTDDEIIEILPDSLRSSK